MKEYFVKFLLDKPLIAGVVGGLAGVATWLHIIALSIGLVAVTCSAIASFWGMKYKKHHATKERYEAEQERIKLERLKRDDASQGEQ